MSPAEEFRRLFPAPRRRPSLTTVLIRWRLELVIAMGMVEVWRYLGGEVLLAVMATLAVLALVLPAARTRLLRLLLAMIIPHRVRSGLIQAGVTDRAGRPPWVMYAKVQDDTVFVHVWLRSGTTLTDLRTAVGVIASACGAAQVEVTRFSARQDRAVVIVDRPRWGWPGR